MERPQCPKCKGINMRRGNDIRRAICPIQVLLQDDWYCAECNPQLKKILDNPRTFCDDPDDCEGSPTCPANNRVNYGGQSMRTKDTSNKKNEPKWEYGHRAERGADGKNTGRTESYRVDKKTGKRESVFHTWFGEE